MNTTAKFTLTIACAALVAKALRFTQRLISLGLLPDVPTALFLFVLSLLAIAVLAWVYYTSPLSRTKLLWYAGLAVIGLLIAFI